MQNTTDEPQPKSIVRVGLMTFALIALVIISAAWYRHAHPPYKWPYIPPAHVVHLKHNAYYDFKAISAKIRDYDIIENAVLTQPPIAKPKAGPPPLPGAPKQYFDTAFPGSAYTQSQLDRVASENFGLVAHIRRGFIFPYVIPRGCTDPIAALVKICDLLNFEGIMAEYHNRPDEALGLYIDTYQHGCELVEQPDSTYVDIGFNKAAGLRRVWTLGNRVSTSTAIAEGCRLLAIYKQIPTAHAMAQNKEWDAQRTLTAAFKRPDWRSGFVLSYEYTRNTDTWYSFKWRGELEAVKNTRPDEVMRDYTNYENASVAITAMPYPQSVTVKLPKVPTGYISSHLVEDLTYLRFDRARLLALSSLLAEQLLIRAYKSDYGNYPTSLTELAVATSTNVATDPFSDGQPLRYARTAHGYLLYSIGPDAIDNGGKPIYYARRNPRHRYWVWQGGTGDIVAGINN